MDPINFVTLNIRILRVVLSTRVSIILFAQPAWWWSPESLRTAISRA